MLRTSREFPTRTWPPTMLVHRYFAMWMHHVLLENSFLVLRQTEKKLKVKKTRKLLPEFRIINDSYLILPFSRQHWLMGTEEEKWRLIRSPFDDGGRRWGLCWRALEPQLGNFGRGLMRVLVCKRADNVSVCMNGSAREGCFNGLIKGRVCRWTDRGECAWIS